MDESILYPNVTTVMQEIWEAPYAPMSFAKEAYGFFKCFFCSFQS